MVTVAIPFLALFVNTSIPGFFWMRYGELRCVFDAMSRRQLISEKRRLEKAEVVTRSMMLKT